MSKVRNAIRPTVFEPGKLRKLGEIFGQVWARLSPEYEDQLERIEDARIRLATIILELAKDGQVGPHQITARASRLIREARRHDNNS
jgi:hypothetical protein